MRNYKTNFQNLCRKNQLNVQWICRESNSMPYEYESTVHTPTPGRLDIKSIKHILTQLTIFKHCIQIGLLDIKRNI